MSFLPRRPIRFLLLGSALAGLGAGAVLWTAIRPPEPAAERLRMGPPPPGYERIRGEAVPGWKPSDQRSNRISGAGWTPLGPRPIQDEFWSGGGDASGRVVSISPHPSDPDTVYLASAGGGIWKTIDGGTNWFSLTDELPSLNHGCVALDPQNPDTVYAGTGEYSLGTQGDGLFRSTDGGANWTRIGTAAEVGNTCSRILVDPTDSAILHVTGALGYVRSVDGGANWSTQLSGRASDVVLDPSNPDRLYVARHGVGLSRSTDGGDTFASLTTGLPSTDITRILLAVAQTAPSTLYAAFVNGSAGLRGLYKTTDGGDNWSLLGTTPNFPSPQGWFDIFLGVDPTDEDIVWAGGVFPSYAVAGVIRSIDGGTNWSDVTVGSGSGQVHPDMHSVAFGPTGLVWVGSDGGIWKTGDNGANWVDTNATLAVTQIYQLSLNPSDATRMLIGTQDNGTVGRDLGTDSWPQVLAGDGGFSVYDPVTPTRRYFTYVRLSTYRQDGSGITNISGPWGSDRRNFIAPITMDPVDPSILYGGSERVWRATNAATTPLWTPISPDLTGGAGALNILSVAPNDPATMYTGSASGKVYVTENLTLWEDRSAGLSGSPISDIVIHPTNDQEAYVGINRTTGGRLFHTTDAGQTWTDVGGALPSGVSVRAVAVDWSQTPAVVYLGTGVGIYTSIDGLASWEKDGADLPNVIVTDLQIDLGADAIFAATFGRGVWRGTLLEGNGIFGNGFEEGNLSAWSSAVGAL